MTESCDRCTLPIGGKGFLTAERCLYERCPHRTIELESHELILHPPQPAIGFGRAQNGRKIHLLDWTGEFAICKLEIKTKAVQIGYDHRHIMPFCGICSDMVHDFDSACRWLYYRGGPTPKERYAAYDLDQWDVQGLRSASRRLWTLMMHESNQAAVKMWLAGVVKEFDRNWE